MRGGLGAAAVADGELVGGVGWEEFGYVAEAFGEGLRGEEGVLALAQFGVVEVDGEGELVDGYGVGEGGFDVVGAWPSRRFGACRRFFRPCRWG